MEPIAPLTAAKDSGQNIHAAAHAFVAMIAIAILATG
jgi:hypothetical protein